MKKNIFFLITVILLIASLSVFGYLFYQNIILNKDISDLESNIKKVQEKITSNKEEIDEKEDEYEKLKETVKGQVEELNIWEEAKEKLNQSLS